MTNKKFIDMKLINLERPIKYKSQIYAQVFMFYNKRINFNKK